MKYIIFVEDNKITGAGCTEQIGENIQNIEVEESVYNEFIQDNLLYIFKDGKITKNPNYETARQTLAVTQRISKIEQKLNELDLRRIRAVCEDEIRDEKTNQTTIKLQTTNQTTIQSLLDLIVAITKTTDFKIMAEKKKNATMTWKDKI